MSPERSLRYDLRPLDGKKFLAWNLAQEHLLGRGLASHALGKATAPGTGPGDGLALGWFHTLRSCQPQVQGAGVYVKGPELGNLFVGEAMPIRRSPWEGASSGSMTLP